MARTGRPPRVEGERRRTVGVSLGDGEIKALHKLSKLLGESQGSIVGRLVMARFQRELKLEKARADVRKKRAAAKRAAKNAATEKPAEP